MAEGAANEGGLSVAGLHFESLADRIALGAILYGASFTAVWIASPQLGGLAGAFANAGFVLAAATAAAAYALSRIWRRRAGPIRALGIAFAFLAALSIALAESWTAGSEGPVRGVSWVCLLLLAYPLLVPARPRELIFTALAGAAIGPALALVAAATSAAPLQIRMLGALFLPNLLCVGLAFVLGRYVQQAGRVGDRGRLGSYKLIRTLGRGGMAEVWLAQHRYLKRPAAIKLVRPDRIARGGADAEVVFRRFEREAATTSALSSPNTIRLYDFGISQDGNFYYVMELLDGLDLETMVRTHGPLSAARAIHILRQVCRSIREAHARGCIHRDIKPANVYVCRLGLTCDFVKVLDFGLVISAPDADTQLSRLTFEGVMTGTPAYMAPEMAEAKGVVDARADVYAIGCVAYWILAGKLVFPGSSPLKQLHEHRHTTPLPPSERGAVEIPPDLEKIVLDCLQKNPDDRPQSVSALYDRLGACASEHPWSESNASDWWTVVQPEGELGARSEAGVAS